MDLPSFSINQATQKSNVKSSNFLITINPNMPSSTFSDEDIHARLQRAIQCVFSHENLGHYIRFKDHKHTYSKHYIKDISLEYAIEKGHRQKYVHAHILLKIKHVSHISLKLSEIRDKVKECLDNEGKRFYLHVKHIRDNNMSVRKYIEKDTPGARALTGEHSLNSVNLDDGGKLEYI